MSRESKAIAGVILVTIPTVMFGGMALLAHVLGHLPGYLDNPLRQALWRAGHAHAGVFLILSLVLLRYVDEAALSPFWKWVARLGAPVAALLIPAAFFLSVLSPESREPNGLIHLVYPGALCLATAVLTLGIGLIRSARSGERRI
jgi:drug/metabolite transporter superfamily protein YnfA